MFVIGMMEKTRGWFHHRAVWLVLPGGKKVVLTARVHKPLFGPAEGELVLLEMPQVLLVVMCPVRSGRWSADSSLLKSI